MAKEVKISEKERFEMLKDYYQYAYDLSNKSLNKKPKTTYVWNLLNQYYFDLEERYGEEKYKELTQNSRQFFESIGFVPFSQFSLFGIMTQHPLAYFEDYMNNDYVSDIGIDEDGCEYTVYDLDDELIEKRRLRFLMTERDKLFIAVSLDLHSNTDYMHKLFLNEDLYIQDKTWEYIELVTRIKFDDKLKNKLSMNIFYKDEDCEELIDNNTLSIRLENIT